MKIDGKVATWLEMAIAPHWRKTQATFRLHPIRSSHQACERCSETCYAVSVDGRWLCSNNGRLTVLNGLDTAERFMQLIKHDSYAPGEPTEFDFDCRSSGHCISMGRDQTLRACLQAATA